MELFRELRRGPRGRGLGERLGYSGTKVEIPVELWAGTSFLETDLPGDPGGRIERSPGNNRSRS